MGLEFYTSRLADAVNWARKYSLFQYPFVTACCGMEFMASSASSRSVFMTSAIRAGSTMSVSSPRYECVEVTAAPRISFARLSASIDVTAAP